MVDSGGDSEPVSTVLTVHRHSTDNVFFKSNLAFVKIQHSVTVAGVNWEKGKAAEEEEKAFEEEQKPLTDPQESQSSNK